MTKKELQEKVEFLEKQNLELEQELDAIHHLEYERGFHLIDHPFIPAYFGFAETLIDNEQGTVRVYSKNGFNIARPMSSEDPCWAVMNNKGETRRVLLPNMSEAIIVLRACGMDISMKDHEEHSQKEQERVEALIAKEEEELLKLQEKMEKEADQ